MVRKIFLIIILFISIICITACTSERKITKEMVDEQNNRIPDDYLKEIENSFKDSDKIQDCKVSVTGKTVYIKIHFNDDVTKSSAKMRSVYGDLKSPYNDYEIQYEIYNKNFKIKGFYISDYVSIAWDDEYDY